MDNVYTFFVDVLYRYEGLEFVWNVQNAAANIEKHGIRFEHACEVFLDPLARLVDAGVDEEARDARLVKSRRANCFSSYISSAKAK